MATEYIAHVTSGSANKNLAVTGVALEIPAVSDLLFDLQADYGVAFPLNTWTSKDALSKQFTVVSGSAHVDGGLLNGNPILATSNGLYWNEEWAGVADGANITVALAFKCSMLPAYNGITTLFKMSGYGAWYGGGSLGTYLGLYLNSYNANPPVTGLWFQNAYDYNGAGNLFKNQDHVFNSSIHAIVPDEWRIVIMTFEQRPGGLDQCVVSLYSTPPYETETHTFDHDALNFMSIRNTIFGVAGLMGSNAACLVWGKILDAEEISTAIEYLELKYGIV